ncbi:positive regulation of fertilization [Desmophyllum pertusum]|uniref:Positive regulation of fertilization n=1 Tax=Desmophyllum pertusum TaxID=174260 RepID=A0A9X0DDE1_9CNID|nr:positive regulation of fertilization [Desmophyllum pertusum]
MAGCYVIVTTRNILWMVLSVVATLAVITGIMTPKWLYGRPRIFDDVALESNSSEYVPPEAMYRPSIGIYNRCKKIHKMVGGDPVLNCYMYVTDFMDIPSHAWKACMVFLCFGTFLLAAVVIMSLIGFCVQSIGKKSIFSLGGVIQAIAALFLVIGLVLYPAGWSNEIVDKLCTRPSVQKPGAFVINDCSLGWAFYAVLGGTLSSFLCSLLSAQAEKSTSSDEVQDEISDGKTVICLI